MNIAKYFNPQAIIVTVVAVLIATFILKLITRTTVSLDETSGVGVLETSFGWNGFKKAA